MNSESDRTKESEAKLDFIEDCELLRVLEIRTVSGNFNLETETEVSPLTADIRQMITKNL